MEGEKLPRISRKGIQEYLNKEMPHVELQNITAKGLIIDHARKGFVRCTFIIPPSASDAHGNWQVGAIATIVDIVASMAICTETAIIRGNVTMDYNISYYSSAKIQEEVEIVAKVVGNKGKLSSTRVEVKKKDDGELIAIAKQWTASNEFRAPWINHPSKL
ncbi:uncharacterized protein LOC105770789 [Gossypium raimondii]|uniref:Acyl-coenzyme A thioesterase 13 n=1 Tax=Gossypium raimondii TaxID=29730 RepID=A0A0D2QFB6_GOSRA|nr:uncharacterized protein LOC105770789 [Gossypium raimondii]XP_012447583.1 uncharacterized protein LOC105770789 [Gossypium raimondii]XP_012447584.1 uncharacterized protein LOC105770789 [Gossypium raimondii]KJB56775.1 hypothetical protein B456_009G135500 [Gossypium raimondii]KJB56776.1 hypothetical protein B456_009G135500 [Gossypium raimondii]KJB56777.1 hypothetical protein B456_009G135500 [Gossypium raimondii]